MKRILAIILALVMISAALAGCTSPVDTPATTPAPTPTPASSSGDSGDTDADVQDGPFAEHMEISYLGTTNAGLPETFAFKRELEEKFNITLIMPDIDITNDYDSFILISAAGDMPDFTTVNSGRIAAFNLYNTGVLRPIPKAMVRENAPNWVEKVESISAAGWELYPWEDDPDQMFALAGVDQWSFIAPAFGSTYRLDWLENVGITPNGNVRLLHPAIDFVYITDEGFTQEQFLQIMDAFKNGDPDGNGANDTIPIAACQFWGSPLYFYSLNGISSMFGGLWTQGSRLENGKTIKDFASNNMKEFL